ncbi:MAG: hypothetical protein F6K19_11990 [Cyanothece sp. SIO1E1]|nr:hypothetical protein [Cyanothece sp. SIO1E1]
MGDYDVLILAVYLICVAYVVYQAIDSLEDQATIRLDQESLKSQLEAQGLQDLVQIQVGLKPRYQFEQLYNLTLSIRNAFPDTPIYVDWDQSSLTSFKGRSRRVIRLTPSMALDLFQAQAPSVISPGYVLNETVTAEDTLKGTPDSTVLKVAAPLIDLAIAKKLPLNKTLEFYLRLVLRRIEPTGRPGETINHALLCKFIVKRLPWSYSLPWNLKKG